jgi:integrase
MAEQVSDGTNSNTNITNTNTTTNTSSGDASNTTTPTSNDASNTTAPAISVQNRSNTPDFATNNLKVKGIMTSADQASLKALKEEALNKWRVKRNRMLADEKNKINPDQVLACPDCQYIIKVDHNYFSDGFRCYNCGAKGFKPITRPKGYFNDVIGFNKVKRRQFDQEGNMHNILIQRPIKRRNKRKFSDKDILHREQILQQLNARYEDVYKLKAKDIRNSALLAMLFLTGSRIEEIVGVPAFEFKNNKFTIIKDKFEIEPVKRKQVSISTIKVDNADVDIFCVKGLPVLKRRESKTINKDTYTLVRASIQRNVVVPLKIEQDFVFFIDRYLKRVTNPEGYLFKMRASNAYKIVYRYFGKKYCHIFRHWRASDLSHTYNFNSVQMQHFFGWSSSTMADRYIHLNDTDLIKSMVRHDKT